MDPSKNSPKADDVDIKIGGESYAPTPDFREDRGAQRIAADAIINALPIDYRRRIFAITKARGMNRNSRRATGALVRLGLRQANRDTARATARKEQRDERELALFLRIEKRIARGLDRPFPGMTQERYDAIKQAFGRLETLQINGQEMEDLGDAVVRMRDKEIVVRQTR